MRRPLCAVVLALVLVLSLLLEFGIVRDRMQQVPDGETVTIIGRIMGRTWKSGNAAWQKAADMEIPETAVLLVRTEKSDGPALMQCYMSEDAEIRSIGETVQITGECRAYRRAENPGEFDAEAYYRSVGYICTLRGCRILAADGRTDRYREGLCRLRERAEEILEGCLPAEDAGVMKAILLGDRGDLDAASRELFQRGGIIHILAVSGLHISLLGMGLYEFMRRLRLPVLLRCILPVAVMISYGQMCGMSASAGRAVVMFAVRLGAGLCHRSYDMLTGLALAALLLVWEQPLVLQQTGFQLSFGAILGIGLLTPELKPLTSRGWLARIAGCEETAFVVREERESLHTLVRAHGVRLGLGLFLGTLPIRLLRGCRSALVGSLGIALCTLGVYAASFHTFSVYAPLLNLLVIPLMSVVMIMGLCVLALGAISVPLGHLPGMMDSVILRVYRLACEGSIALPGATWYMGHTTPLQFWLYLGLLAVFVLGSHFLREESKQGGRVRIAPERLVWVDLGRYAGLFCSMTVLLFHTEPAVRITFLSVGQGDGIILESGGQRVMIDGGSSSKTELYRYQLRPFLAYEGVGVLDAIILTHEDEDHMSGIRELLTDVPKGGIGVRQLILPDIDTNSKGENYRELEQMARENGIPVGYIHRGTPLQFGKTQLLCLGPKAGMQTEEANAYSTILYLRCGTFSALFTGDVEGEGQDALRQILTDHPDLCRDLTLLKVAHHGSRFTTDADFLRLCHPKTAVISCGRNNTYGHPHEEVLERLADIGAQTWRTDVSGAITVTSDGNRMEIGGFLPVSEARIPGGQ